MVSVDWSQMDLDEIRRQFNMSQILSFNRREREVQKTEKRWGMMYYFFVGTLVFIAMASFIYLAWTA